MERTPLSGAEKKKLRGRAQRLRPHVHVGRHGLGETVIAEIRAALERDGLIKVRFDAGREAIESLCAQIAARTGSEHVGGVGRTAAFFRETGSSA